MALSISEIKNTVEFQIYNYVRYIMRYNKAIACGILANAEAESSFNPTALGDNGEAFGLFQWRDSRFEALAKFCNNRSMSASTADAQLKFMEYELNSTESSARKKIENLGDTRQAAFDAAYYFCFYYERPSNKEQKSRDRGVRAQAYYDKYAAIKEEDIESAVMTTGQRIVEIARKQVDSSKPIADGAQGPDAFDGPGLLYYCYNQVGEELPDNDLLGYYLICTKDGQLITNWSSAAAGDIIFTGIGERNIIGIVTGDGSYITASIAGTRVYRVSEIEVQDSKSLMTNKFTSIYRMLGQTLTSPEFNFDITGSSSNYMTNIVVNSYASDIAKNLSRVTEEGFDVGYLIDMTNGGEFRFYIPDFSESAGANWGNVNIIGRSVSILAYEYTDSRKINISLDLYAGEGVYKGTTDTDPVGLLHRDANFLKSLEYPDYQTPITRPPATVHLILGSAVNMIGVVSGVTIEHKKPVDLQNRSMYLKVSFTVTQIAQDPPDWKDIRNATYVATGTRDVSSMVINE